MVNWLRNLIRRLVLWDYRRHVRRHTPNIPARRPEIHAAGMGGNCPSMWRGKDGR